MIRLIAIAGFALSVAVSAQAMTPAPIIPQMDGMITEVAVGCGVGRTHSMECAWQEPPSGKPAEPSADARPE